jgi:hypothetical protein
MIAHSHHLQMGGNSSSGRHLSGAYRYEFDPRLGGDVPGGAFESEDLPDPPGWPCARHAPPRPFAHDAGVQRSPVRRVQSQAVLKKRDMNAGLLQVHAVHPQRLRVGVQFVLQASVRVDERRRRAPLDGVEGPLQVRDSLLQLPHGPPVNEHSVNDVFHEPRPPFRRTGSVTPTVIPQADHPGVSAGLSYQMANALQRTWRSDNAPKQTLLPSALNVGFHISDRLDSGDGDQIRLKGSLR